MPLYNLNFARCFFSSVKQSEERKIQVNKECIFNGHVNMKEEKEKNMMIVAQIHIFAMSTWEFLSI